MSNDNVRYRQLEKDWIKKNHIQVGTKVLADYESYVRSMGILRGWENNWSIHMAMEPTILEVVKFSDYDGFESAVGIKLSDGYWYPFYALELVEPAQVNKSEQESFNEGQRNWLQKHGLSSVYHQKFIIDFFKVNLYNNPGWNNSWVKSMLDFDTIYGVTVNKDTNDGILMTDGFFYPYTALIPVSEYVQRNEENIHRCKELMWLLDNKIQKGTRIWLNTWLNTTKESVTVQKVYFGPMIKILASDGNEYPLPIWFVEN